MHRKRIGRLIGILLPWLVSVIEAIDWLLLCRKGLRIPRRIKGRVIICMNKRIEGIILPAIESIVSCRCTWSIISSVILALLSWIHCAVRRVRRRSRRSALSDLDLIKSDTNYVAIADLEKR